MAGIEQIMNDFNRVKAVCTEMEQKKVLVGIIGGEVDSEIMAIAHSHEYGTDRLPERSFIRRSFDEDNDKLAAVVSGALGKVLDSQITPAAAAESIGAQAAQLVQNFIDDNRVKPQSDFSKKTQHTTLYETGTHIRDRIAYEVVKE